MPSAEFETAYKQAGTINSGPSQDDQLQLYSLAKIAKGEEPKKPGSFDFTGKAKYNQWKKLVDEGITAEQADKQYVELVNKLKEKHGVKA